MPQLGRQAGGAAGPACEAGALGGALLVFNGGRVGEGQAGLSMTPDPRFGWLDRPWVDVVLLALVLLLIMAG